MLFLVSTCCVAGNAQLCFLSAALCLGVGAAVTWVVGLLGCNTLCGPTSVHMIAQFLEAAIIFIFTWYMPRPVAAELRRVTGGALVVPHDGGEGDEGEAAQE
jgi:hypothetical protein